LIPKAASGFQKFAFCHFATNLESLGRTNRDCRGEGRESLAINKLENLTWQASFGTYNARFMVKGKLIRQAARRQQGSRQ